MRCLIFAVIVLISSVTFGQGYSSHRELYRPSGYYGFPRHSSTALEGARRGLADITRSRGLYNRDTSQAMINREVARRLYIENRKLWTQTYFEMRQMNRDFRFGDVVPPTQEEWEYYNQLKLPDRALGKHIDETSGFIHWPVLLRAKEFDGHRDEINFMYHLKAKYGHFEIYHIIRIEQLADEMEAIIHKFKSDLPTFTTIEARSFIKSLKYESQFTMPPLEG